MTFNKRYKAMLIDLDGTLVDNLSALYLAYENFLKSFGKRGNRIEFDRLNGPPITSIIASLKEKYTLPGTPAELKIKYATFIQEAYRTRLELYEGARDTLEFLHDKQVILALVTSSTKEFAESILKRTGILSLFFALITSDDVSRGKPFPDLYEKALSKISVKAEEALAIEDAESGVLAALGANISVLQLHQEREGVSGSLFFCKNWQAAKAFFQDCYV